MTLENLSKEYKKSFWKSAKALNYLTIDRKLSEEVLDKFDVGYVTSGDDRVSKFLSGFITFPVRNKGKTVNIYGRYLGDCEVSHTTLPSIPKDYLYNEEALEKNAVILVESPIDVLTLDQYKFNSCAIMGTRLKNSLIDKFKNKLVFILFDNDTSGRIAAINLAQKLLQVTPKVHIVHFPSKRGGGDDPNSYFARAKRLPDLRLKFLLENSLPIKKKPVHKERKKREYLEGIDADVVAIGRILFKDSDYIDKGSELWVSCPKHNEGMERTRSLRIGGPKNVAWCFGCNKGGNAVFFVSWILDISIPEAVEWIRREIGI